MKTTELMQAIGAIDADFIVKYVEVKPIVLRKTRIIWNMAAAAFVLYLIAAVTIGYLSLHRGRLTVQEGFYLGSVDGEVDLWTTRDISDRDVEERYLEPMMEVGTTKNITLGAREVEAVYTGSYRKAYTNYITDCYKYDGTVIELKHSTDELVGYSGKPSEWFGRIDTTSKQALLNSLEQTIKDIIVLADYEVSIDTFVLRQNEETMSGRNEKGFYAFKEHETGSYIVSYIAKVGGMETTDRFEVMVTDGQVIQFYYTMPRAFAGQKLSVRFTELEEQTEAYLKKHLRSEIMDASYEVIRDQLSQDEQGLYCVRTIKIAFTYHGEKQYGIDQLIFPVR